MCARLEPQRQFTWACPAYLCPALPCPSQPCLLRISFCAHPIGRGGMGEALWIRRGTLARMACETLNCVIFKPRASVSTGARICGCSDTRFFSCFIAISALNMRETRAQHKSSDFASTAADTLKMHKTRASATFTLFLTTPAHLSLRFCIFGSRRALRYRYLLHLATSAHLGLDFCIYGSRRALRYRYL